MKWWIKVFWPINIFNGTNKYSVDSYMRGKQMIFGLQLGATYRITDYLSAFAGVRMNYVSNGYEGHIRNLEANIGGGEMVNVNKYLVIMPSRPEQPQMLIWLQMIWLIMQNMMPLQKKQPRLPD